MNINTNAKKLSYLTLTVSMAMVTFMASTAAKAQESYCREYNQTFTIGGETQHGFGTACLQPDGSWEVMSQHNNPQDVSRPTDITYVVREQNVYVVPNRYIFAPGHPWNHRPINVIVRASPRWMYERGNHQHRENYNHRHHSRDTHDIKVRW
ncbi:MAG: hypothetical protein IPP74_07830 [Alphaproteobacteria bacterium]|nr:hypothetical protein [Alphaproteobacteria bacterium]